MEKCTTHRTALEALPVSWGSKLLCWAGVCLPQWKLGSLRPSELPLGLVLTWIKPCLWTCRGGQEACGLDWNGMETVEGRCFLVVRVSDGNRLKVRSPFVHSVGRKRSIWMLECYNGRFEKWPLTEILNWQCLSGGSDGKESAWRPGFGPWVRKIPWRREWLPTLAFLSGEFHGPRNLWATHSPWGHKKLVVRDTSTFFSPGGHLGDLL